MALQPENDGDEYARPINKDGLNCPLYQKPTKSVCHKCILWQPLDVEINGKAITKWKCSIVWQAILAARANLAIASVESEVHKQNNKLTGTKAFLDHIADKAVQKLEAEDATKQISSSPAV